MPRRAIPQLCDGLLSGVAGGPAPVGSLAWHGWLADRGPRSFGFQGIVGSFTARRESQRNGWYWYAYRRQSGRLRKAYIGRDEDLTLELLERVAADLAGYQTPPGLPQPHVLTTKLHIPPSPPDFVERPRLPAELTRPVTLIVAPAGAGKTTLLAALAGRSAQVGVAWLSIDPADNDPARFWTYLFTALDGVYPGFGALALPLLQQPHFSLDTALPPLLNLLGAAPRPIIVALDDYHVIEVEEIHSTIGFVIDHQPAQLRLVIATRSDPPLPLARLRARGQLHEIRASELRFTTDETARFLNHAMGLGLADESVAVLAQRTEGWAAGLQLAALAVRDRVDRVDFIASFAGTHRSVADYLSEEVISRQSEQIQNFLLYTAALDRMCAELCAAIAPQPISTTEAQALLEQIERANLFLVPLDDERRWYRYHHLFSEMLRDRLRRRQPDLLPVLHNNAARWFYAQGLPAETFSHALAAGNYELAAQIVETESSSKLWILREVGTIVNWLDALPVAVVSVRPRLMLARAWALLAQVRVGDANDILVAIEATLEELSPDHVAEAIFGEMAAIRSYVLRLRGDIPGTLETARRALELLPPGDVHTRTLVILNLENAYVMLGDIVSAEQLINELRYTSGIAPHFRMLTFTLTLGWLYKARGRPHDAYALAEQALQTMHSTNQAELPAMGMAHGALAEILYEWNDLESAERNARTAVELGQRWWNSDIVLVGYMVLANIALAHGDYAAAADYHRQHDRLLQTYDVEEITLHVRTLRAQRALMAGDYESAAHWFQTSAIHLSDEPAPLRAWEYMVLARAGVALGQPHAVLPLLDRLLPQAEQGEYIERVIDLLKLRAYALSAGGQPKEAQDALIQALTLAAPGGYIRLFVDEGTWMASMLADLLAHNTGRLAPYITRLLAASGIPAPHATQALIEPLTEREIEVVRLLAAGSGNYQIAATLMIAPSTVRSHLKSIYAKLGASSRVQAAARARELGLLNN